MTRITYQKVEREFGNNSCEISHYTFAETSRPLTSVSLGGGKRGKEKEENSVYHEVPDTID